MGEELLQCNAEDATNGWSTNNGINKKIVKMVIAMYNNIKSLFPSPN